MKSSSKLQLSSPRPNLYILFAPFFYRRVSKSIPVLLKCSYCVLPRPKIPKLILSQEISPPSSYSFPLRTFKNLIVFSGGSPSPVLASRNMETSLMDCVGETVHGSGLTWRLSDRSLRARTLVPFLPRQVAKKAWLPFLSVTRSRSWSDPTGWLLFWEEDRPEEAWSLMRGVAACEWGRGRGRELRERLTRRPTYAVEGKRIISPSKWDF